MVRKGIILFLVAILFSGCLHEKPSDKTVYGLEDQIVYLGGLNSSVSSVTENGMYEIRYWPLSMYENEAPGIVYANILYTDITTRQKVYLCNVPGCTHNNESCTSYISCSRFCRLFTNKKKDKLYVLSGGVLGAIGGELSTENDYGQIWEMDLDGSNRSLLIKLGANQYFHPDDYFFSSNDALYITICTTDKTTSETYKELVRIDLDNRESTTVIRLEINDVLLRIPDKNTLVISSFSEYGDNSGSYKTTYHSIDLQTQKRTLLLDPLISEEVEIYDDYLVSLRKTAQKSVEMIAKNYLTNEEYNFTFFDIPTSSYRVGCWYDNHFLFRYKEETGDDCGFYVNLKTGEKVTDVISYSYAGHNKLGSIICAFKDVYLITALQEEQTWIINDKEGIPYEIKDEKGNKMAVIKKEDFWKGVSSYEWIEDKTIYS